MNGEYWWPWVKYRKNEAPFSALLSRRRTHTRGRASSLRIVCRSFDRARSRVGWPVGPVSGPTRSSLRPFRTHFSVRAHRRPSRRRSDGELELGLWRSPRRGFRRQPHAHQVASDRGWIGQGGDDPQATAAGRAGAEVGGKHAGEQGRPPQAMGAGRSARSAVRRRRLGYRLGGHDAVAVPGPRGQDPVVAQEMEPGRGDQSRQLLQ